MRAATPPEGHDPGPVGAVFFDKARRFAAAGVVLAGLCAITGSLLDWAVIAKRDVAQEVDFGSGSETIEPGQAEPFAGVDDRDGKLTLAGGILLIVLAVLLLVRKTPGIAWLAFWVSLFVGAIAFGDYRTIDGAHEQITGVAGRQGIGAEASPGPGITIVTAAGMLGIISAVGGVAATPRARP